MRLIKSQTAAAAAIVALLSACDAGARAGDQASARDPEPPTPTTPTTSDWTPLPADGDGLVRPGRHGLTAAGDEGLDLPWAVVEVPDGSFSGFAGWGLLSEVRASGGSLGYWVLSDVQRDPCTAGDYVDVATVEDAADAFLKQRRTGVSAPAPVTLDGHQGLYLELRVPKSIDFATCPDYNLWGDGTDAGRYRQAPGTERVWILDLDGELAVLHGASDADDPAAARSQIVDMVESVEFVRRA